ncbi:related to histidine kinase tcsA protein [Rhynchosporium graminicola]|uniref:histidine kinase n=1 Tax=Rhynchosporium graminicola TaxID=2792576 RepID=A0A1E1L155_9HELO|nr:related to histidine kinase tcsA protein [Rhynchosporium commune]
MDGTVALGDEHLDPPLRLYERLRQVSGYTWDESREPFHSSYDNWQVFGWKDVVRNSNTTKPQSKGDSESNPSAQDSTSARGFRCNESESGSESNASHNDPSFESSRVQVIARVSRHALREERAYHICKNLIKKVDPEGDHIIRPLDITRLTSQQGDKGPIVVCIFENPGPNYLHKVIDYGAAWYRGRRIGDKHEAFRDEFEPKEIVSLETFLDFAVAATECLEILHHGQRIVHGEIRGDAFHMNPENGKVRLINFGSGLRTFEHGLTSTGWSTLSKEVGAKTKLCYMSPEQTGRMPAEPDSRTDIYSLGIMFWTMLTQQPAFDGETPMDIIQAVLGRRLPTVSSIRLDIPDVIGRIIQKMTAKIIGERYHSVSGLRYDLMEVRSLMGAGDSAALRNWTIATKDVSSFFILPTVMIGRTEEHDQVVKVIDKVSRRHEASSLQENYSLSSGSSLSDSRLETFQAAIGAGAAMSLSSDGTSSYEGRSNSLGNIASSSSETKSLKSGSGQLQSGTGSIPNSYDPSTSLRSVAGFFPSHDGSAGPVRSLVGSLPNSVDGHNSSTQSNKPRPWEKNNSLSLDNGSVAGSMSDMGGGSRSSEGVGSLSGRRNSQKFKRKGRCEVIGIAGAAGLGKSCLVQSVQIEARRRGYFASSKFDQAKKTPFGPVLKLLSSLFKQVFSESNTDTAFHQGLKAFVKPAWPMLHRVLGLPEFLLGSMSGPNRKHGSQLSQSYNRSVRSDMRREASPSSSSQASIYSMALGSQNSQEFLRSGSSTKSVRLMNTFLDVLRVFTQYKFICFCLDDLQFADEESIDLISQIVASRMKMAIIVTYRPDEVLPERIKGILQPPNTEGIKYVKGGGVGVTRIVLKPLSEDDIKKYVAATLSRSEEYIVPLAAVIQSKTAGNPFYMREMLDSCHRKHCIYYDYKESGWCYNLDKIFRQFETKSYHDTLDSAFITSRLNELPTSSRSILAWASLIGHSFSFELVQRLLSGEFDYDDSDPKEKDDMDRRPPLVSCSPQDAIEGLQAAIQAYIIIATQDDDRFRFAHDRYMQAATTLGDSNTAKMHFIIARTILKYSSSVDQAQSDCAEHIGESIDIIRRRVLHRQSFRKLLADCAQSAAERGARPTAARYYKHCFALLQNDPWTDDLPDVYYDETLQLHIRAAETYLYMGSYPEAKRLLSNVFKYAKTPVDKSPAWVLQSRVYAQEGDGSAAFRSLKQCLQALNIAVDDEPSYEKCDMEFERLSLKIQSMPVNDILNRKTTKDSNFAAVGAVLVETISAAYWTDSLTFYQMALVMVNTHLNLGSFPQAGMAYIHLSMIAITRFNMIKFASDMGAIALALLSVLSDPYTTGRGGTIYAIFVGHLHESIQSSLKQLEGALEYVIQVGDRGSTILNFGLVGTLKFFASENLTELESFLHYGCEEVPNWALDTRGGTMAIAVRQACRALQGKTNISNSSEIMSDEGHNSVYYKGWLKETVSSSDRPLIFYEGFEIAPLFLYGHFAKAVEVGDRCIANLSSVWSARNTRFIYFIHGLSLAGLMWGKLNSPLRSFDQNDSGQTQPEKQPSERELTADVTTSLKQIKKNKKMIEDWQSVNNVNYYSWSKLLDAQVAEMEGNHGLALSNYEQSLDHAAANDFLFEEALGNYLQAGFFLRNGSRRSARASLREATVLYRNFGAVGIVTYIEEQHSLLLQGATRDERTADVAVQTDFAGDSAEVQYTTLEGDENADRQQTRASETQTKGDRIGAWQDGSARPDAGSGLPALDMLDLTSILESSQVISSVLQVDQLLKTMCEIILQNCGGLATTAAIVVEEDDPIGWSIAASGDPEHGAVAHIPGLPLTETALVAEGVILYCTRFQETVFLPDLIHDERFSNVTKAWQQRNPVGKSVIAIPICHGVKPLLGVLYLEGEPNAFTDRNLTVLQLLVNQIGISYSNALTLKEVEKVSAFNNSMVDVQRRALAKALEAEKQANAAKAEALRNVKLAEEAAKAKSIFLANVSHELRTPLNGVIGNSELLRDSMLTKDQAEMADSIRVSADLLLTVINDILDFSKMEADKMELYVVAFKADEMMREVFRSVSYSNRDKKNVKNVEILQDISLPESLIFGDPVRLHQVLGNLVSNSLKFTENGSITIGAKTDLETADEVKLTFWVKDTGIGIPPQQLVKLFKPFSQADASTARKYGGSGLGLSICKSLIESMMGGKIELESVEGKGTIAWFTVTFQKAKEASAGDCQNGVDQQDHMSSPNNDSSGSPIPYTHFSDVERDQLRICIAEDNPVNQKIAVQFMRKLGFKYVDAYDNGLQAVEGLRAKAKEGTPYHITLMDVQMPVLDGYEATKLLRRDPIDAVRGVLVIAMTASAIQGDREKCLDSGMNDYLAKPVRSNVLKKKLDQYILQPPNATPNLDSEASKITSKVLREMNGSSSPSSPETSGTVTPATTFPSPVPHPNDPSHDEQTLPPGLRDREPPARLRQLTRTRTAEIIPTVDPINLDGGVEKIDTKPAAGEVHVDEEELSPKSIPRRPIGGRGDDGRSRERERDRPKFKESETMLMVGKVETKTESGGEGREDKKGASGVARNPVGGGGGGGSSGGDKVSGGKEGK